MARTQYTSAARAGLNRNGGLRMVARTLNHVESPELVITLTDAKGAIHQETCPDGAAAAGRAASHSTGGRSCKQAICCGSRSLSLKQRKQRISERRTNRKPPALSGRRVGEGQCGDDGNRAP
jgi:hypothetical protein